MIGRLAVIGTIACEALAVYVFAEFVAAGYEVGDQHAIMAITFVAVAIIAYFLPRLADFLSLPHPWHQVSIVAYSFFVLYGTLRLEFAHDLSLWNFSWVADFMRSSEATAREGGHAITGSVFLFVVWIRAASRSADDVDLEMVPRHLAVPFGVVTILLILSAMTERTAEVGRAGAAFYAVAVVTLAASQTARSGATIGEVRAGGITAAMLGGVVATATVLLLLFALFVGIVGPTIGPPLGAATEQLLTWILTPPAWLLERLFDLLFRGASPLPQLSPPPPILQADSGDADELKQRSLASKAGVAILRMLALAFVAAVVAGVVAFALRARSRAKNRDLNAGVASTVGSVGEDIGELFRSLFHRGPRKRSATGEGVIRLYSEVLLRASDRGLERPAGETPAEFAPGLTETFHTPVTDEITAAFQEARYAGRDPDPHTLAELERRWRQVT